MKKNIKLLIAVIVAVVVLVGVVLLLVFLPSGDSDGTATYDEGVDISLSTDSDGVHQAKVNTNKNGEIDNNSYGTLIDYIPAKISKIHLENKSGTLDITSYTPVDKDGKTDTTQYTIVGYEDFELQAGAADSIANDAAAMDFSKVVTLDKDKAKDFGFDEPRAEVTVTYTDNTKAVIILGNEAPQGAGAYVKFGGGDEVYLVETDAVDSFLYGLTDMFSLAINSSATDEDKSQASSIELSGSNFPDTITLKPNTNTNNSASYVITKPSECYASEGESSKVEGAIRGLYADSVRMVNPSDSQLKSLGLSTPYAEIKAKYPDTEVDIISSKPDGDGNVCVMKKGGKVVYQMTTEKLPWVITSYDKLVCEYVLHPQLTALSAVSVNDGKNTYDFKLSSKNTTTTDDDGSETTSTTTTVKYKDTEIDLSHFSTFFQNVSLIERTNLSSDSASGTPVFSITYTYSSDNSSDTVSFYNASGNKCLAVVNGKTLGYIYTSSVNKLMNQASTVAKNQKVDSFTA